MSCWRTSRVSATINRHKVFPWAGAQNRWGGMMLTGVPRAIVTPRRIPPARFSGTPDAEPPARDPEGYTPHQREINAGLVGALDRAQATAQTLWRQAQETLRTAVRNQTDAILSGVYPNGPPKGS